MNPLLHLTGLPAYPDIQAQHVAPAMEHWLEQARATIAQVLAETNPPTWDNVVRPVEVATERLNRAWGVVNHLNHVLNSAELREAYNHMLPRVTEFYTDLGQNLALYARYKALAAQAQDLSPVQQRLLEREIRDFRLSGAELPPEQQQRFKAIQEQLAQLSSDFSDHVLDATDAYHPYVEAAAIPGLPEEVRAIIAAQAEADGHPGQFKLSLHMPVYLPIMQYCDNRELRAQMYRAYVTRASELGAPEHDNSTAIAQMLALRQEEAQLLGYANYAELSLVPKMAASPGEVKQFLLDLAAKARPYAERDWQTLQNFAREQLGLPSLEAWDMAYASEKLRQAQYAFSELEVKPYFPLDAVLTGLFKLTSRLFGIDIRAEAAPVWHPEVQFFRLERAGQLVGQFYLDVSARANKRGGAWMDDAITRWRRVEGLQTPVAYLVCNFSAAAPGQPVTLTHDEVLTMFHEFGHGLHHLLTEVDELGASGIHGVEWDAVELPSQMMELFCWEWDVLQDLTRHIDTGLALPRDLYERMLAARYFQSGLQTLRQIEFSLFDWVLHSERQPEQNVMDILQQVRAQVAVVPAPAFNRFPHSFSHIFAGGYAAGYYSYKWAEVLASDAYARFEEEGIHNPTVGFAFWHEFLARGSSRPAMESFVAFRGRQPDLTAMLRHLGMSEGETTA